MALLIDAVFWPVVASVLFLCRQLAVALGPFSVSSRVLIVIGTLCWTLLQWGGIISDALAVKCLRLVSAVIGLELCVSRSAFRYTNRQCVCVHVRILFPYFC